MASLKSLPLIDGDDVEKYLEFQALFNGLQEAFVKFSQGPDGGIVQPIRRVLSIEKHQGYVCFKIGYSFSPNEQRVHFYLSVNTGADPGGGGPGPPPDHQK